MSVGTRRHAAWAGALARIAIVLALIGGANVAAQWVVDALGVQIWPEYLELVDRAVVLGLAAYVLLMAVPFVPGIEMGLVLMVILGARGVVVVYLATLLALAISFGAGRLFPPEALAGTLRLLGLARAASRIEGLQATPREARLAYLAQGSRSTLLPKLLSHRYLLLAVLLNLPGNVLLGGGGGIAMAAGMSRLFPFPATMALIAVAILPGPVVILLTDWLA